MPVSFVAVGSYLTEGNGTTAAIAGPAGVAENDIVLAVVYTEGEPVLAAPAGFTLVDRQHTTGAGDHDLAVYWRRATSSEPGTYTFSWSGACWRTGWSMAYRGCLATGDPVDAFAGATTGSSSNNNSPPIELVTTGPDRMVVWVSSVYDVSQWTHPTDFTATSPSNAPTSRLTHGARRLQAAAGNSGNVRALDMNITHPRTAILLALTPADAGASGPEPGRMLLAY